MLTNFKKYIINLNTNVHCQKALTSTFCTTPNNCIFFSAYTSKARKVKISLTTELIKFEDTIDFEAKNIA